MRMSSCNNTSVPANDSNNRPNLDSCFFTDSVAAQICKLMAYCVVLLIGLVGNVVLAIIIRQRQELRRTVNYFIINMAISDFAFSLADIPIKLSQMTSNSFHWRVGGVAGSILCKVYNFSTMTSLTVSLQSSAWIAVDRFIAVVFPMKVRFLSPRYRAIAIASTWVLALAVRAPYMMAMNLRNYKNATYCGLWDVFMVFDNITAFKSFSWATEAIFLILPLILVTTLYFIIAVTLKRRIKQLARISSHIQLQVHDKNAKAVKMALCMMFAYDICFIPYLILSYGFLGRLSCSMYKVLSFFVVFLLYLSSTINPLICFVFVRGFRIGLKWMLNKCFKKCVTNKSEINSRQGIVLKSVKLINSNK